MSTLGYGAPPPLAAALAALPGQPVQGAEDAAGAGPQAADGGLGALQDLIDDFPALLHALSDPQDVDTAVKALGMLTGIQRRLMQGAQGGPGPQGQ